METANTVNHSAFQRLIHWVANHKALVGTVAVTACAFLYLNPLRAHPSPPTFQVTTYNTLAPTYAGINGGEWYKHIDPSIMAWEYRQEALLAHIKGFQSDVICLQEVEPPFFSRLQSELGGYQGVFLNQGNKPGQALFFREPFKLNEATSVIAGDGRLGQVVELQWGDQKVALLNCHLSWDEGGIKAHRQMQDLFERGLKPRGVDHLIICGDFNVPRDSKAVEFLEKLGMHRAYTGVEPSVTCSVQSAAHEVDFILARQSLKPMWVKPVHPVTGLGALPCAGEPSDHLAKTAIFSL